MVTKILIALDGNEASDAALNAAIALALRLNARLALLHVLDSRSAFDAVSVPVSGGRTFRD